MRIGTWNLERGGKSRRAREAQGFAISDVEADALVLTEPGSDYRAGPGVVTSPVAREGKRGLEPWVAIVGPNVEPIAYEIPFTRMAAAARCTVGGRTVILYGSVLPWLSVVHHAPELVLPGETALRTFVRTLNAQVEDVRQLQTQHGADVMWAGDFNQSLVGSLEGGSRERRKVLKDALVRLGFVAWNEQAAHAQAELCAFDLICGSAAIVEEQQGRIDPRHDGVTMSDHAGYWVDV